MEKLNFNLKKSVLERDFPFKKNKTLSFVLFLLILSCFHNNANGQSYTRTQSWASGGNGTWATFDWGANCKNLNTIVPSHALNISVQITMTGGDFDLYTYNNAGCPTQLFWTSRPFLGGTSTETVSGLLNYCNSLNTTIGVRKAFAGAGTVTITVSWTVPSYNINSTSSLNETFNTNSSSIANWLYQSNVAGTSASPSVVASGTNVTTSPQEGDRMVFYNSYGIAAGGQSRLISPTLNTSGTGTNGIDVEFYWRNDNGYATSDDRVQVQYSTDNGCTWVNAGPTFSRYNASGGTGTWNFQSVSIGAAAVGANVRVAFLFTSQYGNNCFLDNVTMKQRCFNGNVATFGSNVWNAYCYSSGDNVGGDNAWNSSTVRGMYSMSTLNFDTRTGQTNSNAQSWGDGSTPSNASGYSGCAIDIDFHSYIFKRQGFPCGTYQLNLPSHDDMAILLVDGIEVWRNYGCCATRTAVWTGYLGSTSTVELRITEGVGGSHGALELIPLTISATVTPTNPTTCGGNGSIAISNPQNGHNMAFRSDLSANTGVAVSGNAAVTGGELVLTSAANSQTGSAILTPAVRSGAWTANYSQFIGAGSGADGMAFTFGPISGAANGNAGTGGESGWASGLVVSFDTYTSATNSQLTIYWNGGIVWQSAVNVQNFRTSYLIPVKISVNTSNQLSVTWNSIDLLTNYALPAAYGSANKSTWNYGFSARTGGLNDAHKVSDVYISSIANLEYSINGTTWSATTPISAPAGTYTVQARPAVGVACPATIATITLTNPNTIDWANLQFPSTAAICATGSATVYGRVYKAGYTSVAGADASMTVQIGYSTSNTNPNTWTNWVAASYNAAFVDPSNDEYMATLSGLTAGTYYYTMRYKYCTDGAWYYGGYNVGGGGFYNGTTNVNGVLTVNALPTVTANTSLASVCAGAPVTLTGGGANTYSWNNSVTNGVSFVPASTATYTVTGTSAAGCINTAAVSVTVNALPTVTASASSSSVCAGSPTTLSGGGATTYTWNNGVSNGVSFVPASSGSYTVTGTNSLGCTNTASISITVNTLPTVTASASTTTPCAGSPVTLTGGGANTYSWNNGVSNGVGFVPASSGSYTVTGTDALGCNNTSTLSIAVNALPTVNAGVDQTACAGALVTVSGSGANSYSWNNGVSNGVAFTAGSTTTYTVTGTSAAGCTNTDQVLVTVNALSSTSASTGDYIWKGTTNTDWSTASNWLAYNGTSYAVATVPPTSSNKVIIPVASSGCVVTQPATITNLSGDAKDIVIESGASLGLSSATLNVYGNWTNNGTFTPGSGTIAFVGNSGNQTITKVGGETISYLVINKSSGNVILANTITVSGGLTLTNGLIELGANNLVMGGASLSGGSSSSYVKTASTGVLKRNLGNTGSVFFPVGNSAYNPAELTNTLGSDIFSLRVVEAVYVNGTSGALQSTSVVNRTWMIEEAQVGGNSVTMKLYWNGNGEEAPSFLASSAFVAHYVSASSMWDNMGGTTTTPGYVESTQATSSFSPFTISSSPTFAPLPVELMSLEAQCAVENVIVSWKTASEHNSLNFIVERSEDGTSWSEIQTVAAAGNSNTVLDYAIEDAGAARGVNYYRLIQTDQDGAQKIYGPVLSNCGSDDNVFMSFPNPSDAEITLVFNNNKFTGPSTLTVQDANGRTVRSIALEIQPGTNSILVPDMELTSGVYYLHLAGENFTSPVIKHSLR